MSTRVRARGLLVPLLAVAMCVTVGLVSRAPAGTDSTELLAHGFSFDSSHLNHHVVPDRQVRQVQPALAHIDAWISAVGASVGLADFSGDGYPNEVCLVDPRDDSVTIAPVPTRARTPSEPGGDGAFELAPMAAGSDSATAPMGCVPADLNGNGHQDVLVYYWGRPPVAYVRLPDVPLGEKAFVPVNVAGADEIWNTTTVNVVDVDGDGQLDLVVGNYFPDGAQVLDPGAIEDPYMQMQDSMSLARNGGVNRLLLSTGTVVEEILLDNELGQVKHTVAIPQFVDASDAFTTTQAQAWTLAIGAQDLTGDGRPDLYFANDFGPDNLLVNRSRAGNVKFDEVTGQRDLSAPKSKVLGQGSFKGMGVAFADLNENGQSDILVSNITSPYGLYESNFAFLNEDPDAGFEQGQAPYRDESERLGLARSGWGWDIRAADFNADGQVEIIQATGFLAGEVNRWPELQELAMTNDSLLRHPQAWPNFRPGDDLSGSEINPFFVRGKDGRFVDLATELDLGNPGVSRALAVGDVDRDGRLDFAVANQWADSMFFHNTGRTGSYLGLQLEVPSTTVGRSRPAIGASVNVVLPDGTTRHGQLYPSNGHSGTDAPDLFFGLGDWSGSVEVTITWRDADGRHTKVSALRPGWHTILLEPGRS